MKIPQVCFRKITYAGLLRHLGESAVVSKGTGMREFEGKIYNSSKDNIALRRNGGENVSYRCIKPGEIVGLLDQPPSRRYYRFRI